jgi:hypothetical protein
MLGIAPPPPCPGPVGLPYPLAYDGVLINWGVRTVKIFLNTGVRSQAWSYRTFLRVMSWLPFVKVKHEHFVNNVLNGEHKEIVTTNESHPKTWVFCSSDDAIGETPRGRPDVSFVLSELFNSFYTAPIYEALVDYLLVSEHKLLSRRVVSSDGVKLIESLLPAVTRAATDWPLYNIFVSRDRSCVADTIIQFTQQLIVGGIVAHRASAGGPVVVPSLNQ